MGREWWQARLNVQPLPIGADTSRLCASWLQRPRVAEGTRREGCGREQGFPSAGRCADRPRARAPAERLYARGGGGGAPREPVGLRVTRPSGAEGGGGSGAGVWPRAERRAAPFKQGPARAAPGRRQGGGGRRAGRSARRGPPRPAPSGPAAAARGGCMRRAGALCGGREPWTACWARHGMGTRNVIGSGGLPGRRYRACCRARTGTVSGSAQVCRRFGQG
jgi:hypothetical protein